MTAANSSVRTTTTMAVSMLPRAAPTTSARRHQAVTSPAAAQARATLPRVVSFKPLSVTIRAKTGNAVIDIATPMNSAKLVNGTSLIDNRGYR